jgi:hypothetical protein
MRILRGGVRVMGRRRGSELVTDGIVGMDVLL